MENNPWITLSSKDVYNNKWIAVTEYEVINPSGGKGIYGKIHFKNIAVGVVALDPALNIWLVGQYRYVLNAYSWEIPEGGAEYGTNPLESAKRELKEETGVVAREWKELFKMHLSNSVSDELAIIYLATELEQYDPEPEATEQLVAKKVALEDAWQMVERGEITDSISVAAITKIKLMQVQACLK